jgi:hypothetical protein
MIPQTRVECEFLFPSRATVMNVAKDLGRSDSERTTEKAKADRLLTTGVRKNSSACLHLDLPTIDSP